MNSLQGFYCLKPSRNSSAAMEVINNVEVSGSVLPPGSEVELARRERPFSAGTSPVRPQKLHDHANGHPSANGHHHLVADFSLADAADEDDIHCRTSSKDKFVRRRQQKTDMDHSPCRTPELLSREDTFGTPPLRSSGVNSLALRLKSGNKADLTPTRTGSESLSSNGFSGVRKSSTTPNFEESDGSSLWSTEKWKVKSEVIAKSLLDGWPKLLNKIALD